MCLTVSCDVHVMYIASNGRIIVDRGLAEWQSALAGLGEAALQVRGVVLL